jgi:hypothetical protein
MTYSPPAIVAPKPLAHFYRNHIHKHILSASGGLVNEKREKSNMFRLKKCLGTSTRTMKNNLWIF